MGFALGIFPVLAVMGIFKLRRNNKDGLKLPGFPVTQIIYILTGIMILVLSFLERPRESSIALLVVAAGIPAFFIFRKANASRDQS
jgi:APA family basic amino acid/polyamine antiporter